ncbi:MAG TPA: YicC/YloC family endoribonuclease [Rhodospirillales bacterium]|nr:YicC/YloC family endoribonuclease [Rhodospirillales bacterium]
MSLSSMTGFARAEGRKDANSWTWEIKSVNAKGLDVRSRLPSGFESLEKPLRDRAAKRLKRGNVSVALNLRRQEGVAGVRVNHAVLEELLAALPEIRKRVADAREPSLDGLLALRGVVEPVEEDLNDEAREALETEILNDFDTALEALAAMRDEEGVRLAETLQARLDDIAGLCAEAEKLAAMQPNALRARLKSQVRTLLEDIPAIPEERLAQEAVLLMSKADLREELDRLQAHQEAALELMNGTGAVGRKLDFLCQEFNREANTLCSKSQDIDLTRIGLELKAAIEQLREQVQNIE